MNPMEGASTVERMLMTQAKEKKIPINGSIELLPLCNMNCEMCYVHMSRAEMEKKGRLRTAAEWIALGKEMQKAGTLFLLLTGGEPLLYPEFKEVYLGLRALGMILTINTNGTLLDEKWADFFKENKPRRINITLYGADEAAYERLCHYPGGYEKTVRAVKLLRERGIDVRVGLSATPENAADIDRMIAIGHELDCPVTVDTYMMPARRERDAAYNEAARLGPEEAARIRVASIPQEVSEEAYRDYILRTAFEVENFAGVQQEEGMTCLAANCSYTINWQGNMRPCVIATEPSVNVFENGFMNAWEQVREGCAHIRLNEKCSSCKLRPVCRTCAQCALLEGGAYDALPEYMCRYSEESWRLMQEIYEKMKSETDAEAAEKED